MSSFSKMFSDEKLQLVTGQIFVGQAILIACKLGIFKLLINGPLSIKDISHSLKLEERSVQAMISCACALELIECDSAIYKLSQLGQSFLNETSSLYYGGVFDLLIQQNEIMSFENIEKAILTNKPQVDSGTDIFSSFNGLGGTRSFVKALHQKAFAPAFHWPKLLNLNEQKKIIDIGGGSGIHAIAACLNNPLLRGIVCDREPVLPYTQEYIKEFGLEERISVNELDMWENEFPEGDVCFFGDIFHDWKRDKCISLAKKCFRSLSEDGLIILHEMLFDANKTGPFLTSAYNMKMMLWTEGQQFSHLEMQNILQEAGFREINVKKSLGNWSLIIGKK